MKQTSNQISCPRCGKPLENRHSACPHCGYDGYIPMSEAQIKRIKLILSPIAIVLAILAIFLIPKLI